MSTFTFILYTRHTRIDDITRSIVELLKIILQNMYYCASTKHVLLCQHKTCIIVPAQNMYYCASTKHVLLCQHKTCIIVPAQNMYYCASTKHVLLCQHKTCIIVPAQNMYYCASTKHVLLCQHKLIKMRGELTNLSHCAGRFLGRAAANLCWYYITLFCKKFC